MSALTIFRYRNVNIHPHKEEKQAGEAGKSCIRHTYVFSVLPIIVCRSFSLLTTVLFFSSICLSINRMPLSIAYQFNLINKAI